MYTVNPLGWDLIRIISALLVCPRLAAGTAIPARIPSSLRAVATLTAPPLSGRTEVEFQPVAVYYAEAVRNASLTVLKSRRALGESTHPFYWAGFVAAGDWR
jgi:hypothetical protein